MGIVNLIVLGVFAMTGTYVVPPLLTRATNRSMREIWTPSNELGFLASLFGITFQSSRDLNTLPEDNRLLC